MQSVPEAKFESLVADQMDLLPDDLAEVLANVSVTVEDRPADGSLRVLAVYSGVPLTERGQFGPEAMPDNIVLYRESMLAHAHNEDELKREIWNTLIREIGMHLGMDEDQLERLSAKHAR
ncbi:metallopeptidase family protein [Lysinibacter cavernae]|uniref:Putative Zn-dependent protease with MMP-like domain n=1 Tax=Lysinibacter cavernae TaxID=1640652 RepID=A0A7X5TTR5_9MICO|nr:metallopeptidase family protein [Lysinibacter cavernae]NIH53799.1 putative Zn-dependent protease with MMP-like domain [Lysinibacter cavernae]